MKKELKVALYARVSTTDKGQDTDLQLVPLREYCNARGFTISGEYVDQGISGSKDRRPQLDRLMETARKRQVDIIVCWRLDRLGRSLKHLILTLEELNDLGVSFISYSENLDLSTATGKLMFHVIASMCEFERSLIQERVKAGLANAKRKGRRLGRKPVPPVDRAKIIDAHKKAPSLSIRELARTLHMTKGTVYKTLQNFKSGTVKECGFAA